LRGCGPIDGSVSLTAASASASAAALQNKKSPPRHVATQPGHRTEPRPESPSEDPPPPPFLPSSPTPHPPLSAPARRKEGSEILLPCAIIPTDRRRHGLPVTRRWRRGEAGGRWEGAGGRRQRSSEREEERLKAATGNRSATPPLPPSPLLLLPQLAPTRLPPPPPPPPWVPPAAAMGTPHQSLQPPLCPWAMS